MGAPTKAAKLSKDAKNLYIESAARSMEDLVERLQEDKKFAAALSKDPKGVLAKAGISLEKEAIELLIATDPKRFDRVCDKLFEVLSPDLLAGLVAPSCGVEGIVRSPRFGMRSAPKGI